MPEKEKLINVGHLDADLRLEVLGNEMLDSGIEIDQILVSPRGGFYRGFRKDVADIEVLEDNLGNPLYYRIFTSRDGIYDGIPENVFHDNLEDIYSGKVIDPIENIKKNKKEEEAARSFFQIVEKEIFRLKILFEREERKSIIGTRQFDQHEIFLNLWSELDPKRVGKFIPQLTQILPLASKFHGNLDVMEKMLKYLLQTEVSILTGSHEDTPVYTDLPCLLGSSRLGHNAILGGSYFDFEMAYTIQIGPLTPSKLELYMPNKVASNALKVFCEYYFPIHSKINFQYFMQETQNTILLSQISSKVEEDVLIEARLGLSSFL
jgi:type VI secretion system protein ImpH